MELSCVLQSRKEQWRRVVAMAQHASPAPTDCLDHLRRYLEVVRERRPRANGAIV
jgi:hypothetical protein